MDSFLDPIFSKITDFIIAFFSGLISVVFYNHVTIIIFGLLFFNSLGFFLMKLDKKIAKDNAEFKKNHPELSEKDLKKHLRKRISEITLILTALVGGSLGILGGMYVFRHKTHKPRFTIGIPLIIGLQIVLIIYNIISTLISNNAT